MVIVEIPDDFKGACARCREPAVHCIFQELSEPIPAKPEFGFPEVREIRCYVCDSCLTADDILAPE